MKVQKEHRKETLMRWTKDYLVDYVMCLEHNINAVNESFDNQYNNCLKILDDMKLLNKTYFEAKTIIKKSISREQQSEEDCRECVYFVGCECFSGTPCNEFTNKQTEK